jgi:hypothetical protein
MQAFSLRAPHDQWEVRQPDTRGAELPSDLGTMPHALEPGGVSDGTRTRDHLDHNQALYQLSYTHQGASCCSRTPVKCSGYVVPYSGTASGGGGTASANRSAELSGRAAMISRATVLAVSVSGPGGGTKIVRR